MTVRSTLRHEIARIVEAPDFITGTVDSGTTTTIVDALELTASNDSYKGRQVYIYYDAGAAAAAPEGEFSRISASLLASTNITFPALTTAPGAGDLYEIHARGLTVVDYNDAINAAYRAARRSHLINKTDETLMFSNLLLNGAFDLAPTTSTFTSWTATDATLAREASLIWGKLYSAKLTATAALGYFGQSVANYPSFAGKSATLTAMIYSETADEACIQIYDGVNTNSSAYHQGQGFKELTVTATLDGDLKEFTGRLELPNTKVAYVGRMELRCPKVEDGSDYIWEYTLPTGFRIVSEVWRESSTHNEYDWLLPGKWWYIKHDTTRKLVFRKDMWSPPPGYRMKIVGQAEATEMTADTDTVTLNEEYVKAYAIWQLLLRDLSTEEKRAKAAYWGGQAQSLLRSLSVPMRSNSKSVEVI